MDREKVLGTENPGDAFTKYLNRTLLEKTLGKLKVEFRDGKPESAPSTKEFKKP